MLLGNPGGFGILGGLDLQVMASYVGSYEQPLCAGSIRLEPQHAPQGRLRRDVL